MRLIHTSDWHLGRHLKGKDRTPEIEFALQQLLRQAKELEVAAVLIAGDIFETSNPPAEAERVAYQFFEGLRTAKIPAIAIAGNHDSASRFDGIANLVSLAGVHMLGKPRSVNQGGLISLETPNGRLRVAAMPFASERRLLTVEKITQANITFLNSLAHSVEMEGDLAIISGFIEYELGFVFRGSGKSEVTEVGLFSAANLFF